MQALILLILRYHLDVDRTIPPVEEMDGRTTRSQETGRKP